MKRIVSLVLALTAAGIFSSCATDIQNNETPNALVASVPKVTLTLKDTVTDNISLVCGCPFKLTVTAFMGDTTSIKYSRGKYIGTVIPLDTMFSIHPLAIYAGPNPKKGTDTAWLALAGGEVVFYDTVQVILNNP